MIEEESEEILEEEEEEEVCLTVTRNIDILAPSTVQ